MVRRDMPEVLAIEHESFGLPWCEEDFLEQLKRRNCIGMVAEHADRVVGFMIYELHKTKILVLDFATHPDFRRRGVGRQMLAKLAGKLSSHRRTRVVLAVRETNVAGQLFLRAAGYRATRVARGYFDDTGEDAFVMRYALPEGAAVLQGDES